MHAVVGVWSMEEGRFDEQRRELQEHIVPNVTRSPGFIAGYWALDPATGKTHTMIVLRDENAASQFKTNVMANASRQAEFGLAPDVLTVVEVIAEAHSQSA